MRILSIVALACLLGVPAMGDVTVERKVEVTRGVAAPVVAPRGISPRVVRASTLPVSTLKKFTVRAVLVGGRVIVVPVRAVEVGRNELVLRARFGARRILLARCELLDDEGKVVERMAWGKRRPLLRALSWRIPLRATLVPEDPEERVDLIPVDPVPKGQPTPADPATRPKG